MTKNKELSIRRKATEKEESIAHGENQNQSYLNETRPVEPSAIPRGLRIQSLTNDVTVKEQIHCASAEIYLD